MAVAVCARAPAALRRVIAYPELLGLLAATGVLNLWNLSINGFANTYYAAAVKSMSTSWHDFLFASMDKTGLMTVDKPPLALWVQALSARIFGFSSWSILVPQALMGIAAAGLMYDMVRRRFGRFAGFVAGLTLATTPIIVAVSAPQQPGRTADPVHRRGAVVRAARAGHRAHEVARVVWRVRRPRVRDEDARGADGHAGDRPGVLLVRPLAPAARSASSLAGSGGARVVRLQDARGPATVRRGWCDGGRRARVAAARDADAGGRPAMDLRHRRQQHLVADLRLQRPRPGGGSGGWAEAGAGGVGGGGAGGVFGGPTGLFRLLESGARRPGRVAARFALAAAVTLVVVSRLRRADARTGYVILFAGSLLVRPGLVFSFASGIFHPYYVSYLAPMIAALVGAGAGMMLGSRRARRGSFAPALIAGGAITELVVLGELGGQLTWAVPVVVAVGGASAALPATALPARARRVAVGVAIAALLAAPATWAAETLGHATSGTFPAGGPASAGTFGGGPGGGGGRGFRGAPLRRSGRRRRLPGRSGRRRFPGAVRAPARGGVSAPGRRLRLARVPGRLRRGRW